MLQNPTLKAYPQPHHLLAAPTYTKGRICIAGDAAHCMTPWQGSGAAQALEDAAILDAVLGAITHAEQIPAAFRAYDGARRARSQRIVESSAGTGVILCGRGAETGLDIGRVRELLPGRWGFIYAHDQGQARKAALKALEKDLEAE